MPSWEVSVSIAPEYHALCCALPSVGNAAMAVEQTSTFGWARLKEFNFTADAVIAAARAQLKSAK